MHRELLIEIGCEEIPASWLPSLTRQLGERVAAELGSVRLESAAAPDAYGTPRRLVVRVAKVADRQTDLTETLTGPPVRAAFDAGGAPTPAALGFARKHGVAVDQLQEVETHKGAYLAYRRHQRGGAARTVLGDVLAATLRGLAFPTRSWMTGGASSCSVVRSAGCCSSSGGVWCRSSSTARRAPWLVAWPRCVPAPSPTGTGSSRAKGSQGVGCAWAPSRSIAARSSGTTSC